MRVLEAPRGIDTFRVSFAGSPTTPGETDLGHLVPNANGMDVLAGEIDTDVSSSGGAQTSWVEATILDHEGAYWSFWTEGDDAFDVATFTLDVRYLAPPG